MFLSTRLRVDDLRELDAAGYSSPLYPLKKGLEISDRCWTGLDPDSGEPAVLFGVARTAERLGFNTVWLLGTEAVTQNGLLFARRSRRFMRSISDAYGTVGNAVDLRNAFSTRWLAWLGFRRVTTVKTDKTTFGLYILDGREKVECVTR